MVVCSFQSRLFPEPPGEGIIHGRSVMWPNSGLNRTGVSMSKTLFDDECDSGDQSSTDLHWIVDGPSSLTLDIRISVSVSLRKPGTQPSPAAQPMPATEQAIDGPLAELTPAELSRLTGESIAFRPPVRPLRQQAATTSEELKSALTALAADISATLSLKRVKPKLAANASLLALNLYAAHRQDERLCVALPMGAPWYSAKVPRNADMSFRHTVEQAWKGLEALGYAERFRTGSPYAATYTLIRALPALVAYLDARAPMVPSSALRMAVPPDPLVLKGPRVGKKRTDEIDDDTVTPGAENTEQRGRDSEHPMVFADTQDTERMWANVIRINAINTPDRIRLPDLADDHEALFDDLWGSGQAAWRPTNPDAVEGWFAETQLHRSFSRGSFEVGGRFYGAAWQQMPKRWRQRILIDDEAVVELDYGSLHPRLLHHMYLRVEAPDDCYAGIDLPRDLAKRAVSMMLNAENGVARAPEWFRVDDAGMAWKAVRDAVTAGLPRLRPYFGTGIGLKLQRVDSDMAEQVMLHFAGQGIPCLGVHDSFLVAERHAEELEAVMREAYRSRAGYEPVIKPG